jgi:hypothetical protein
MKGLRFIPLAVLVFSAVASTACATGYGYGGYRDRGVYRDGGYRDGGYYARVERAAYDNGFRDGLREGERDGRRGRRFEPSRHGEWRDADGGFRREYGDHNVYRRSFRSGFEAGYAQGYRRFDDGRYRRW